MIGYTSITRSQFYLLGGFSNTRCVRIQRGKCFAYFYQSDTH
jgi:hypothetical protein